MLGIQQKKQDGWGRRRHERSRSFCRLLGRDAHKSFRKNSDSPHFLKKYRRSLGGGCFTLSNEVAQALSAYAWPGNVRELENMMERAVVLSQGLEVGVRHLPQEILITELPVTVGSVVDDEDMDLEARVAKLEKSLLNKALGQSVGNKAKAARLLKISERTLWYKLKKYGLT